MRRFVAWLSVAVLALPGLATAADPRVVKAGWLRVHTGMNQPLALAHPPGDARLFVVERPGRIRVIRNGHLLPTPYLDISSRISTAGEGGLLGLAFRPDFRSSGFFYVTYTDGSMTLRVVRFHATPTSDVASIHGSLVMSVPHPTYTNHNGGQLAFGRDGYLYISTGDGGGGGDPNGNSQNLRSLLGKILRIDVLHFSGGKYYAVPPSNPFATSTTARHEIWHYGLRNPWRFSFDMAGTTMWIGDVGQGDREEVDRVWRRGGVNWGWDCREGTLDTSSTYGGSYCGGKTFTPPSYEYSHSLGCAIIGGYVYRGTRYKALMDGTYVFGDYCSGRLWGYGTDASGHYVASSLGTFGASILGFGQDVAGEVYILSGNGNVYRMTFAHR